MSSSTYLGPRNKPGRLQTPTFSLKLVINRNLGSTDKIILPESVLNEITRLFPNNPPNPIIFEIHPILINKNKKAQLHCSVKQFTADPKTAQIPYWMTYCLKDSDGNRVKEGVRMKFRLIRALEPVKFVKFRPLDKRFARDIVTPRASLENALRGKFTVLTKGQRLPIINDGKVYPLKVEEVAPSPAAHLIDAMMKVEFVAFDEMKAFEEQDDVKGLINGSANNEDKKENDQDDDDDDIIDAEELPLYTTVTNTAKENKAIYYKVKISNKNYGIRCVLKIESGDGNIYVHNEYDKPAITQYLWYDESDKKDKMIEINNNDSKFKSSNWFYVGIHSYKSDCLYSFHVDQDVDDVHNYDNDKNQKQSGNSLISTTMNDNDDDMIPPNMQKCENCGKLINKSAYMMHEMRCAQINFKCSICNKVMAKSMKSKHIHCSEQKQFNCPLVFDSEIAVERHVSLRHRQISCTLCSLSLYPNQMVSHQQHECTFRKVSCSWCGMRLKYLDLESHEKFCGALTIECELCGETVTRKWLQNHLASEHNINPTLQTTLINTIIHSNLGLDQSLNWNEAKDDNNNGTIGDLIKGLDEDENDNDGNNKILDEIEDLDPFVKDIKRQLSQTQSVGDVTSMERVKSDPNAHDKINENEEEEYDDDVHDFVCPFCQKHPPKTQDFGEHLASCSEKQMLEDSD